MPVSGSPLSVSGRARRNVWRNRLRSRARADRLAARAQALLLPFLASPSPTAGSHLLTPILDFRFAVEKLGCLAVTLMARNSAFFVGCRFSLLTECQSARFSWKIIQPLYQ